MWISCYGWSSCDVGSHCDGGTGRVRVGLIRSMGVVLRVGVVVVVRMGVGVVEKRMQYFIIIL